MKTVSRRTLQRLKVVSIQLPSEKVRTNFYPISGVQKSRKRGIEDAAEAPVKKKGKGKQRNQITPTHPLTSTMV